MVGRYWYVSSQTLDRGTRPVAAGLTGPHELVVLSVMFRDDLRCLRCAEASPEPRGGQDDLRCRETISGILCEDHKNNEHADTARTT
jgi:hypothetical protein